MNLFSIPPKLRPAHYNMDDITQGSIKNQKIASIVYSESAKFFSQKEIANEGLITVTGVDVSKNSKSVSIWVGLINIEAAIFEKRIVGLQKILRRYIADNSSFQYVPNIFIKIDTSPEQTSKVFKLLSQ